MIDREQGKYAPLCSKFSEDNVTIDDFMPYLTPEVVFSWEKTIEKHAESLDIKVRKREPIKEAVREAKSKIEKEKKEILKDEISDYGDFE